MRSLPLSWDGLASLAANPLPRLSSALFSKYVLSVSDACSSVQVPVGALCLHLFVCRVLSGELLSLQVGTLGITGLEGGDGAHLSALGPPVHMRRRPHTTPTSQATPFSVSLSRLSLSHTVLFREAHRVRIYVQAPLALSPCAHPGPCSPPPPDGSHLPLPAAQFLRPRGTLWDKLASSVFCWKCWSAGPSAPALLPTCTDRPSPNCRDLKSDGGWKTD